MTSVEPIEFYGSLQSPYCYFALNRLTQLSEELSIPVVMRSVLPGVIRIPDSFSDRSELEKAYFDCDVDRTAQFLDLDFSQAKPLSRKLDQRGKLGRCTTARSCVAAVQYAFRSQPAGQGISAICSADAIDMVRKGEKLASLGPPGPVFDALRST